MKVCLAAFGTNTGCFNHKNLVIPKYILESFIYWKEWEEMFLQECDLFILDSGVFTFLTSQKNTTMDWYKYADEYAEFIKRHNIKNYIELDIYKIVGIEKTEKLRNYIEDKTGVKSMPVFHRITGLDYYKKLISDYKYICIGGIACKDIKKTEYKVFTPLIDLAHKNNCKVHGLGFTSTSLLHIYHFDSVDSSSWTGGWRFGQVNYFCNGRIKTKTCKEKRVVNGKEINDFNIAEWEKFQRYAKKCL